jgi:hypothetical protein
MPSSMTTSNELIRSLATKTSNGAGARSKMSRTFPLCDLQPVAVVRIKQPFSITGVTTTPSDPFVGICLSS